MKPFGPIAIKGSEMLVSINWHGLQTLDEVNTIAVWKWVPLS
jgi:hypothetical protein